MTATAEADRNELEVLRSQIKRLRMLGQDEEYEWMMFRSSPKGTAIQVGPKGVTGTCSFRESRKRRLQRTHAAADDLEREIMATAHTLSAHG